MAKRTTGFTAFHRVKRNGQHLTYLRYLTCKITFWKFKKSVSIFRGFIEKIETSFKNGQNLFHLQLLRQVKVCPFHLLTLQTQPQWPSLGRQLFSWTQAPMMRVCSSPYVNVGQPHIVRGRLLQYRTFLYVSCACTVCVLKKIAQRL